MSSFILQYASRVTRYPNITRTLPIPGVLSYIPNYTPPPPPEKKVSWFFTLLIWSTLYATVLVLAIGCFVLIKAESGRASYWNDESFFRSPHVEESSTRCTWNWQGKVPSLIHFQGQHDSLAALAQWLLCHFCSFRFVIFSWECEWNFLLQLQWWCICPDLSGTVLASISESWYIDWHHALSQ